MPIKDWLSEKTEGLPIPMVGWVARKNLAERRKPKVKKVVIAFVLALAAIMVFGGTALAWDYEDPCVADNEDFIAGGGFDDGVGDFQSGTQPWPPGKNPSEGYNLYRDDVTDTGNLDKAFILTFTPDEVNLSIITSYGPYPKEGIAEYWYMGEESPDTWYWALEPRGYDDPVINPNPTYIKIVLPDASERFQYCGKAVASGVDFNDGTWRIQIPAGTWILRPDGSMAYSLVVDSNGNIVSNVRFVYNRGGEVTVTRWGP